MGTSTRFGHRRRYPDGQRYADHLPTSTRTDNPISFPDEASHTRGRQRVRRLRADSSRARGPTRSTTPMRPCRHSMSGRVAERHASPSPPRDSSASQVVTDHDQRHGRRPGDRRHEQRAQCHRRRHADRQRHVDHHGRRHERQPDQLPRPRQSHGGATTATATSCSPQCARGPTHSTTPTLSPCRRSTSGRVAERHASPSPPRDSSTHPGRDRLRSTAPRTHR